MGDNLFNVLFNVFFNDGIRGQDPSEIFGNAQNGPVHPFGVRRPVSLRESLLSGIPSEVETDANHPVHDVPITPDQKDDSKSIRRSLLSNPKYDYEENSTYFDPQEDNDVIEITKSQAYNNGVTDQQLIENFIQSQFSNFFNSHHRHPSLFSDESDNGKMTSGNTNNSHFQSSSSSSYSTYSSSSSSYSSSSDPYVKSTKVTQRTDGNGNVEKITITTTTDGQQKTVVEKLNADGTRSCTEDVSEVQPFYSGIIPQNITIKAPSSWWPFS